MGKFGSISQRMTLSYILIILAVLALLNTYPLIVSENMVFRSKQTTMQSTVSVMVSALSGLDVLTEKNVAQALTVAEDTAVSRVLVTDADGLVLYDDRESGGAVGSYALYTEIVKALQGSDAFYVDYSDGAFRSRAASPVVYRGQIIGAVYVYEYDTEQASLLSGLQQNLRRISLVTGAAVLLLSLVLSRLMTARFSRLMTAIRVVREGEDIVGQVGTNVHYAIHVEYGHRTRASKNAIGKIQYVPGVYFLHRALRENRNKVMGALLEGGAERP